MLLLRSCSVDLSRELVRRPEGEVRLTSTESGLLAYLSARPGRTVSRDELLKEVWGYQQGVVTRTVDAAVTRLRRKIERDPSAPDHLRKVHGTGYRFDPNEPELPGTALAPETTRFFGRESELLALDLWNRDGVRLVSLVGPGGTGKTRLARRYVSERTEPVVWCELEGAEDLAGLCSLLARALGVGLAEIREPVELLGTALCGRGSLWVVLDDVDRVAEPAALALTRWMATAPLVRWLVTSRARLGITGEQALELPPLPPADAIALWLDRARAVRADFDPTGAEDDLKELVARLDGIPLAIELAAARVSVLPPRTLLARLPARFDLLADRRRSARHASLEAVFACSWELLEPAEQAALCQCTVFAAPFSLEDAEAVLDGVGSVLDVLERLVHRSLVRALPRPGGDLRYALYESIRWFAASRLQPASEGLRARHRARVHAVATAAAARVHELEDPKATDALAVLQPELLSLRGQDAALIVWCLEPLLTNRGPAELRRTLLQEAVADSSAGPVLAAWASARYARELVGMGEFDAARQQLARSLDFELPDAASKAYLYGQVCVAAVYMGALEEGEHHARSGLALAEQPALRAMMHDRLAIILLRRDQWAGAETEQERAIAAARRSGSRSLTGRLLANRGALQLALGRPEQAMGYLEEARIVLEGRSTSSEGTLLHNLASACANLDMHDAAQSYELASIRAFERSGWQRELAIARAGVVWHGALWGKVPLAEAEAQLERILDELTVVGTAANQGFLLGQMGLLAHLRGAWTLACERFRTAAANLAGHPLQSSIMTDLARALADGDQLESACAAFEEGERLLAAARQPPSADAALCRAHLQLARARAGQLDRAVAEEARRQAIEEARRPLPGELAPCARWLVVRIAVRLLEQAPG